jgi:membrane protease YdiL (CAAX protease family)
LQDTLQKNNLQSVNHADPGMTLMSLLSYLLILGIPGCFINQLPIPSTYGGLKGLIWFIYFIAVTFSFKNIRALFVPLLKLQTLKEPKSYLFIGIAFIIPYAFLHFCLQFKILLNKPYIFYFENHMLPTVSWGVTIDRTLLTPIIEEILFRGILLTILLSKMKPFWAISIVAVIFALVHESNVWIFTLLGGILLTITVYKTNSLIPALIAHSLWNLYLSQFTSVALIFLNTINKTEFSVM